MMMRIIDGDFSDARVLVLLRVHLTGSRANTAPGSAHALDIAGLQAPDISFWTIWEGETLLGCGALRRLAPDHGEIKSMHTAQAARRTGVGSAMLRHIIATARAGGMARLSLDRLVGLFRPGARALCPARLRRVRPVRRLRARSEQRVHDARSARSVIRARYGSGLLAVWCRASLCEIIQYSPPSASSRAAKPSRMRTSTVG